MELDLNIDSNGNVIVNTLSEYVAYISQLQAANEGSNERFFFRGQSNKNWDVRPCLFRENNLTIESDIISEACARAPFEFGGRSAFERLTTLWTANQNVGCNAKPFSRVVFCVCKM